MSQLPIYLDYQATTPMDPAVLDAMMPYLTSRFGNPHSASHVYGWQGAAALDVARERVGAVIGAAPDTVYFTSGATEANNLAIKGTMAALGDGRPHLVTCATEHKCVLECAHWCARRGYEVTIIGVDSDGLIDMDELRAAVSERTALVSIMAVNNEIGVIQPIVDIARIAHEVGALFHTDAAQAFGKIPLDVDALAIDLLSISAHKTYGPKGVGALYVRNRSRIEPLFSGGGQEGCLRSGTQAPALVAGFGKAAEIAAKVMDTEAARLEKQMTAFKQKLKQALPLMQINGHPSQRWQGNLNLSFPGLDGVRLLADMPGLALSSGAACSSAVEGPSYVLEALGLDDGARQAALRIGIGRFTSDEDLLSAADQIIHAVRNQL